MLSALLSSNESTTTGGNIDWVTWVILAVFIVIIVVFFVFSSRRNKKKQEEAQQLQIGRINASLARVQSIEHDPHIPLSKKLEIAMAEKNRVDRVAESTREFIASGEFDELPTRSEELQANEDALDAPAPAPEKSDREEPECDALETEGAEPDQETSAERKVRKARVRAAYAAVQTPDQPVVETMDTWA